MLSLRLLIMPAMYVFNKLSFSVITFTLLPPLSSSLQVCYTVIGWLDKNKDPLNDSVVDLLKKSTDPFVAGLWADYSMESERGRGKKGSQFVTVGQIHKKSLHHLLTTLRKYNKNPKFASRVMTMFWRISQSLYECFPHNWGYAR